MGWMLRNSASWKEFCRFRRRIGNFRFVCSFCVDFLVSELEIGIAIGFRWRWWNAALTDEPVNWPTSRLCVCRTGQTTDRPTEYVRPYDRLTDRENPFTLRQFNWIHHFEGDTLSMQLLRFVFTSGTSEPIHIRRAAISQQCQWFVIFWNLFKSINPWTTESLTRVILSLLSFCFRKISFAFVLTRTAAATLVLRLRVRLSCCSPRFGLSSESQRLWRRRRRVRSTSLATALLRCGYVSYVSSYVAESHSWWLRSRSALELVKSKVASLGRPMTLTPYTEWQKVCYETLTTTGQQRQRRRFSLLVRKFSDNE